MLEGRPPRIWILPRLVDHQEAMTYGGRFRMALFVENSGRILCFLTPHRVQRENKIMKAPLKKKKDCVILFPIFFEQLAGFSALKVNAGYEIFTGQGKETAVEGFLHRTGALPSFLAFLSFGGSLAHYV